MKPGNWRRPLKDGGVQFYISDGKTKMDGSVAPAADVDELARLFEQATGSTLPPVETKEPRSVPPSVPLERKPR